MSSPGIPRRQFLASGLTLAGVSFLGGGAVACRDDEVLAPEAPATPRRGVDRDGDLLDPPVIASVGGVLTARLVNGTTPVRVGGRQALEACTYDGQFPGPTLRVRPGDLVDLTLVNRIVADQMEARPGYGRPPRHHNATNLHYHGMHVSPEGLADNMALMVPSGGTQRYLFRIPDDHPAGLYWYHGHVHGTVTSQVGRGGAGMLYVANAYTDMVAQLGIRHRLLMLQQAFFQPDLRTLTWEDAERDDPARALSLINGELVPDLRLRPGEPQVWSLVNASASAFYALRLHGHTFEVIAEDGVPLVRGRTEERLVLASGKRLEVVVRASGEPGRYPLSYDAYDQGVDTWPQRTVGTVVVAGPAWTGAGHPGPDPTHAPVDLSREAIRPERRRRITLGTDTSVEEGEFGRFTMNGHAWDPAYREWTSTVNTVEEWEIVNETEQEHPFHVHINPFQVTHVNGARVPFDGYQDTAIVPRFGAITVRTRLADFTGGLILMHCHILDHEDMGMMTSFSIAPAPVA